MTQDSHSRFNITQVQAYSLDNRRLSLSNNSCQRRKRTFTFENETQTHLRCFVHQHLRYIWSQQEARFTRLSGLDRGWKCVDLIDSFQGYSKEEQQEQSLLYGRNSMELASKVCHYAPLRKGLAPFLRLPNSQYHSVDTGPLLLLCGLHHYFLGNINHTCTA
nr:uncharacterized protein LOC119171653 [Rhipicephalus microplus]